MPLQFPTDEETVLVLLERVNEAQRLAVRELREMQSQDSKKHKRKRSQTHNDGPDGIEVGASANVSVIKKGSKGSSNPKRFK